MTTENKHTPGPWYAVQPDHAHGWWIVSKDPEGDDCLDASGDGGFDNGDARLIAAAPDLFEASPRAAEMLRVVSAFLRDQQPDGVARYDEADCDFCCIADDCDASAEDIEDAIAKARGQ